MFVSAEDIFRPLVPARYIETKREAERGVADMLAGREDMRAVFVRPSAYCPFSFILKPSSRARGQSLTSLFIYLIL